MTTGRAWIELDRDALLHNLDVLRGLLPSGCALMPVLKANAYGHGAVLIARELYHAGIRAFCVATAQEGIELRENGVAGEILILGYTHPMEFQLLRRYDLTQTVLDRAYAETLNAYGERIRVQIKIDTGMHRLGAPWDNPENIKEIFNFRNLQVMGVYTHLCADTTTTQKDMIFTLTQSRRFYWTIAQLTECGCDIPAVHILSSCGLLNYPEIGGNCVRTGLALYGILSRRGSLENPALDLRPVLSLKARVALIQSIRQGGGAGYDLSFTAKRDSRIAVLTIGYADGLPRSLSGAGNVLLHGREAPIAGSICMDQTLVDVTDIPDAAPGDAAVLIGKSGDLEITACGLAERTGTISNEIVSRLGARLGREMIGRAGITKTGEEPSV